MRLSQTIIAATIGAGATVSTALFQLFSAIRANAKSDARPRKGSTARSVAAVVALMVASAVGGFLFSEFRQERTAQNMNSMREELNAKLQALAATTERLAAASAPAQGAAPHASQLVGNSTEAQISSVESVVFASACTLETCGEESSQSLALCGAIPQAMQVSEIQLFIAGPDAQEPARAQFDEDMGGARFVGPAVEHAQGLDKAVCVTFKHWSTNAHLARMILRYGPVVPSVTDAANPSLLATDAAGTSAVIRNASIDGPRQ